MSQLASSDRTGVSRDTPLLALGWGVLACLVLLLLPMRDAQAAEDDFLAPEQAFQLQVMTASSDRIELQFKVAPGYHLYRERISATTSPALPAGVTLQSPAGKMAFDAAAGKDLEVYGQDVTLTLPVAPGSVQALEVTHQGCADKGLCYPPQHTSFRLTGGAAALVTDDGAAPATPVAAAAAEGSTSEFSTALASRSLWRVAGVFLLAGLLLSFTPCVLPMIPILSSIIVGQSSASGPVSRLKGFSLAAAYALGMALVYTAFGMVAGLLGEGLADALQNAWVLGAFALLLCGLALSMFGVYELQMPSSLQSRVSALSGQLSGGQHAGVFLMGGLSALIVGPCVAAPLAGALVYISQTRDVVLGGVALFALACGMSVPLLLVGLSAGSLLPRAGGWMERVKHLFGAMLMGVALWMVSPVLPPVALMLLCAAGLLVVAVYLGALDRLPEAAGLGRQLAKGLGVMVGLVGALELTGAASGGRELLQPLAHLALAGGSGVSSARAGTQGLAFATVKTQAELDQVVQASAQPVMVDVYADWCVACKEFESLTLSDAGVRQRLAGMKLVRVDVTDNGPEHKALMKRFSLFGPPALLFFRGQGGELAQERVVGFQPPEHFVRTLERVRGASAALKS